MRSTLEALKRLHDMTPEERARMDYLSEVEEAGIAKWDADSDLRRHRTSQREIEESKKRMEHYDRS